MIGLSCKQREIAELDLGPLCVTACAGSGKTRTAVHRLREMRRLLNDPHGIVALLSFSNVAVDTFRKNYFALPDIRSGAMRSTGVEIDTVDGFITGNVLRPHAHRTMGAARTAFLVQGSEPFLSNYAVYVDKKPLPIKTLSAHYEQNAFTYKASFGKGAKVVEPAEAEKKIAMLGKTGAYTHSLGRYWTIKTLQQQTFVLRAIARRYPHILIDEAQDIGREHQAILEMLMMEGVTLSLIGDANQGIYKFAGADGTFLEGFNSASSVVSKSLTVNYRSAPDIVTVANKLTGRTDAAHRPKSALLSGAYCLPYKDDEKEVLLATFNALLLQAGITHDRAVILFRGAELLAEWRGAAEGQGQGTVRAFAEACLERDKHRDLHRAFKHVCDGVVALLDDDHSDLTSLMSLNSAPPEVRRAKRLIWSFMRDADNGLPSCTLAASTAWHPALKTRVTQLLAQLENDCGLKPAATVGNRLAKTKLTTSPLSDAIAAGSPAHCKTTTVHQVKGESIPGVMYLASKTNVDALLKGTGEEVGRIGYVALTRACDLFVLAVPEKDLATLEAKLIAKGFSKAPV